ncbi:MAG: AEC family transporter [Alphaproteobacteria bacterium]|nr:AEC family transporter [Alphaproteobacteria bacterium]MCB9974304.1 AEC family transporter [Rhodospirillales bacterium]
MDVFFSLLTNLLPLYILIGMGFVAARYLKVDRQSLASLAIFMFMPIVVFGFVVNLEFQPSYILLPIVIFVVSVITGVGFLALGKKVYGDNTANLMAMCCSMGNTGYFGLPLVFLLFNEQQTAIYIFMMLGGSVYEATYGYYLAARGAFDVKTSLKKLAKFPALYAITLGFIANGLGYKPPELFWTYWAYFKGAYVVLGMMIVGAALAGVQKLVIGPRFMALVFLGKFLAWPVLVYTFVLFDKAVLQWYPQDIHNLILIMSLVPPAANIAAFAAQMNMKPEKAATTILLSTIFALVYIPAMIWLLGIR